LHLGQLHKSSLHKHKPFASKHLQPYICFSMSVVNSLSQCLAIGYVLWVQMPSLSPQGSFGCVLLNCPASFRVEPFAQSS
jgi:hypothetical protein